MLPFEKVIPVSAFRELLNEILARQPGTCVRFRLLGKMWESNFFKVLDVDEHGAIFGNVAGPEKLYVTDLNNIVQFELDIGLKEFQPHFHYDVRPEIQTRKPKP